MSLKVYRGRTLARSQALQLLFQAEQLDRDLDQVIGGDYLISKGPLDPYAIELSRGAYEHIDRIDAALEAVLENWSLERLPGADRNLLRIALFEMRFLTDDEIDDSVVINEAVELAKAYGTDESSSFVNGVLGRIASESDLPGEDIYEKMQTHDLEAEAEAAAEIENAEAVDPLAESDQADVSVDESVEGFQE